MRKKVVWNTHSGILLVTVSSGRVTLPIHAVVHSSYSFYSLHRADSGLSGANFAPINCIAMFPVPYLFFSHRCFLPRTSNCFLFFLI